MELEEMRRLAASALEGGWDQVLLPAADVLALRPPAPMAKVENNSW